MTGLNDDGLDDGVRALLEMTRSMKDLKSKIQELTIAIEANNHLLSDPRCGNCE